MLPAFETFYLLPTHCTHTHTIPFPASFGSAFLESEWKSWGHGVCVWCVDAEDQCHNPPQVLVRDWNEVAGRKTRHHGGVEDAKYLLLNLLVCSLPLHRHSYIGFNSFLFIDSY